YPITTVLPLFPITREASIAVGGFTKPPTAVAPVATDRWSPLSLQCPWPSPIYPFRTLGRFQIRSSMSAVATVHLKVGVVAPNSSPFSTTCNAVLRLVNESRSQNEMTARPPALMWLTTGVSQSPLGYVLGKSMITRSQAWDVSCVTKSEDVARVKA